jgi:hypothetical protein
MMIQMDFNGQRPEDIVWLMTGPNEDGNTDNVAKDRGPDEDDGGSWGMQHDVLRRDDLDDERARIDRDNELDDALLD